MTCYSLRLVGASTLLHKPKSELQNFMKGEFSAFVGPFTIFYKEKAVNKKRNKVKAN